MVLWPPKDVRPGRTRRVAVIVALVAGAIAPYPPPRSATPATIDSGSTPVTCTETQRARVTADAPWRCTAMFAPNRSYVVRVDRQQVDVTLELVGPDGKRALKVDSITHRAGPEFLLYRTPTGGKHVLVVDTDETGAPPAVLNVELREMRDTSVGGALSKGLAALTTAATVSNGADQADTERRIAQLRAALPDLKAAGARELEAEALLRIASLFYWILNDWTKAAAASLDAMQAFDRVAQPTMSAQAANIRGASLAELAWSTRRSSRGPATAASAQFQEAGRLLEGAASRFKAAGMKYDEAHALNNLGLALYYQAQHDPARERYLAAARLFSEAAESTSETLPLQNVAVLDFDRGDYAAAVASYQRLLPLLDPERDRSEYVAILNNLGTAQFVLGNTDAALKVLLTALPLTENDLVPADRARTLHALGRTYLIVGDEERAAIFLEQALAIRRSPGMDDRRGLLNSLIRNGDLHRERGAPDDALKLHLQALDEAVSPEEITRVLLAVGLDQMAKGEVNAAIESYQRALKLDLADDWPVRVSVTGAYGYARMRSGSTEGRALLISAARTHEDAGDDELAARDYYLLASVGHLSGKLDAALRDVGQSLALYESQRIRALNPDLRATYVSTRAAAYELQAEIYMSLAERTTNPGEKLRLQSAALFASEALRGRALNDFRQFARSPAVADASADALLEIDSRLAAKRHRLATVMDQQNPSPERVTSLRRDIALLRTELDVAQARQRQQDVKTVARPVMRTLGELQRSIASDAMVVTWILGEQRSWVWAITREQAAAYPLAGRGEIERAARDLYGIWSRPTTTSDATQLEIAASRRILGSSGEMLAGKRTIVVVADGVLRAIPVGALWVETIAGAAATRIAEAHDVYYRPALGSWASSRGASSESAGDRRILLVGDPVAIGDSAATRRLPASRKEIDGIVKLAVGWQSEVLLGDRATKSALLAEPLNLYRVLHFATHARLDVHDPQLSAVVLSGSGDHGTIDQSALSLREIVGLDLSADTVVLSACEGSLGKDYRGQLSFGLSEAFLLAGSRNVLASLWRVSDSATEQYMQSFYEEYLRRGLPSPQAAQSAARTLMKEPAYSHPFYWAAFVTLAS